MTVTHRNLRYFWFILLLFIFAQAVFSLTFSLSPSKVFVNSPHDQMFYLNLNNPSDSPESVTITSYLLSTSKKFFLQQTIKVSPHSSYIFRRLVYLTPKDNGIFYFILNNPNKILTVPVVGNTESNVASTAVSNENNQITHKTTSSNQINQPTKHSQSTQNPTVNENSAEITSRRSSYSCKGTIYFYSYKNGVTNRFDPNERVIMISSIPDEIKNIDSAWNVEKIAKNYYELTYPGKVMNEKNVVFVRFAHCGTVKAIFYENVPKQSNMLFILSVLTLIVIFLAYYVELNYRDEIRLRKKLKRK